MNVLWPGFLILLGLLPLIVAAYILVLRRRRKYAVRFSSLALVRAAMPRHSWLRRHLPFALLVMALSSLTLALSRPVAVVQVPSGQATIILAMDVSRSMCSTDITPSRLDAAKTAALSFIEGQEPNTQMGLVAFAGFSALIQAPTTDQDLLQDAVRGLTTGRGTAIGSGLFEALNAIAEINDDIEPVTSESLRAAMTGEAAEPSEEVVYAPEIIVLLTDGVTTTGIPPLVAAQQAAQRGVRVYTIGFGTSSGGSGSICGGWGGQGFGFGGGGGGGFRRGIDEPTLIQVADMTGGDYYAAESAGELREVFANLPASFSTRPETTEISFVFAAFGALLAALAMGLALLWQPVV